jgi:hypothetical protein
MGYRNYLGSLPKKEYNKIKSMTLKDLYGHKGEEWSEDVEERDYIGTYTIVEKTEYELGKYVDQFPKEFFKPVFKKKETQKYFTEEHDFYLVEKEFVEHLINCYYSEKVRSIYKDLLDPFLDDNGSPRSDFMTDKSNPLSDGEVTAVYRLIDHVKSMGIEWGVKFPWLEESRPYSLDPERELVSSWKYEHAIFNLVNLYRTFDWKRNIMIYYGY